MGIYSEAFVNAMMSCSVDQGCLALGTQALYLGPSFDSTCSKIALNQVDGAPGLSPDVSRCAQQNDSCKDEYVMDAAQSATIHGIVAEHCPAFVTLTSDARGRAAHCADLPCPDFQSCLGDVFGKLPPPKKSP